MNHFNFDNSYTQLPPELYSLCNPTSVKNPILAVYNDALADELGLKIGDNAAEVYAGNLPVKDAAYIAQAYSGHQFGHFTPLGDGRAILLGEHISPDGNRVDLQLKGSGVTPYSHRGDGRATLSAMLREYIISEAMHALKIPTTRSLAVVATGEAVYRDEVHQGAVLTRVAASHIRVGTFEHIAHFCSPETLKVFTNYTIKRHYPELLESENPPLELLATVLQKQIELIVNWMRVGFIHGVMNTDNMTISGETIDYGPCAFMNAYNPNTVFSSIDSAGRYSFGNQPSIALWNLTRLAESLLPLIDNDTQKAIDKTQTVLNEFQLLFYDKYRRMMAAKIGLTYATHVEMDMYNQLLEWMHTNKMDYTNTFVELMYPGTIGNPIYQSDWFIAWTTRWNGYIRHARLDDPVPLMQKTNPVYIPRNHKVEEVLKNVSETGNVEAFNSYVELLKKPYSANNLDPHFMLSPSNNEDATYKTYCGT